MASMLEGGGKTPMLTPTQLESMGFKLVAYPLSLLAVSVRAMQDALTGLKAGRCVNHQLLYILTR
jgi:2-methylisocitrate lyase-like PEP mutase family enzyme